MSLNRRTPLKGGSGFKSKGNGLKSNSTLKSNSSLKSSSSLKSDSKLESKSKINAKSSKQAKIDSSYAKKKKEVYSEDELCTGCRNTYRSTPSHLIPRSRRSDLIDEIENLKPHCLKCHDMWESPRRMYLLDYEENMEIVKRLDTEYHALLLAKQERWLIDNQKK